MKASSNVPSLQPWTIPEGHEAEDYHSFIYRLTFPDGTYYLGKKSLWTRKAGKINKASNWSFYLSSSKDVAEVVAATCPSAIKREILMFCVSAGEASWQEMLALVGGIAPAVLDPKCRNRNVLMSFNRRVLEGYADDDRRERYLRAIANEKKAAGLIE